MTKLRLDERELKLQDGETVLEGLLRTGHKVPNSCRSGVCQSCLMVAEKGAPPAGSQAGIKQTLRDQGYFLSCIARPTEDLAVRFPDQTLEWETEVLSTSDAGAAVRVLRLASPEGFTWRAGQFITLLRPDGIARSYSLASMPADGYLELHVRSIPGGIMSNWLHDEVTEGTRMRFRGPLGECFYTAGDGDQPLLLSGTGTGLAPLYGILRDALAHEHRGPIILYHGAVRPSGLYYVSQLKELARQHANVHYKACVLDREGDQDACVSQGALDDVVLSEAKQLKHTKAFLCGDPAIVKKMRKQLFLKGMSNRAIFADPFVPSAPAGAA